MGYGKKLNFVVVVADGVALGAAVSTSKTEVEVIVFVAIMLHKVNNIMFQGVGAKNIVAYYYS